MEGEERREGETVREEERDVGSGSERKREWMGRGSRESKWERER